VKLSRRITGTVGHSQNTGGRFAGGAQQLVNVAARRRGGQAQEITAFKGAPKQLSVGRYIPSPSERSIEMRFRNLKV